MADRIYGIAWTVVFLFLIHTIAGCAPASFNKKSVPLTMPGEETGNAQNPPAQTAPGDPLDYSTKGSVEISRLESARGRLEGHPKLVALLVGEDYRPRPGGPDWGGLNSLPGVWMDLARMHEKLKALGFGRVMVLGGGERSGAVRNVQLGEFPNTPGGKSRTVRLPVHGPATRAEMLKAAAVLRKHLYNNRMRGDGKGGDVPPLFLFYYSGHGFMDVKGGVHRLPIADRPSGEKTGPLLNEIMEVVGADEPSRGSVGGGSSLVFLDC